MGTYRRLVAVALCLVYSVAGATHTSDDGSLKALKTRQVALSICTCPEFNATLSPLTSLTLLGSVGGLIFEGVDFITAYYAVECVACKMCVPAEQAQACKQAEAGFSVVCRPRSLALLKFPTNCCEMG